MPNSTVSHGSREVAPANTLKVGVIEDLRTLREGYRALIDGTDGYRCTSTFRTMEEALAQIGQSIPDVLLVDIGLPGMSGTEGIRILKRRYSDLVIVMLTIYDDDDRILEGICAGACGYLLKRRHQRVCWSL